VRPVVLVAVVLALAGCGGGHTHGTATLWVTQDHGAHVLFSGTVPAGLTAMQTLTRVQKVGTRYGGRYVQSIDGISGSLSNEQDWFFFVNGIESGTGAAEVKLKPGDIEWWDYRSWKGSGMTVPVVVGAFPEPFVHGFQWAKPGATIKGGGALATLLQRLIPAGPNEIDISSTVPPDEAVAERQGNRVRLVLGARIAEQLSSDPTALRYRYAVKQ
jgi:Domain of unknown function (DUF4430)